MSSPPLFSRKQFDFHLINIEDIAFRSTNQMIIGLRSPLSNRTNGNAYYLVVTNVSAFAPETGGWTGLAPGVAGPYEMNLGGLGIRSIKWCPDGLTNSAGQAVQRYLILAGNANGGPIQRENLKRKFSLYSWTGDLNTAPVKFMEDLQGYAIRPEGIDLMNVGGEWRVILVEDSIVRSTTLMNLLGFLKERHEVNWRLDFVGLFLERRQRHSFPIQRPDAGLSMTDDDIARLYV